MYRNSHFCSRIFLRKSSSSDTSLVWPHPSTTQDVVETTKISGAACNSSQQSGVDLVICCSCLFGPACALEQFCYVVGISDSIRVPVIEPVRSKQQTDFDFVASSSDRHLSTIFLLPNLSTQRCSIKRKEQPVQSAFSVRTARPRSVLFSQLILWCKKEVC